MAKRTRIAYPVLGSREKVAMPKARAKTAKAMAARLSARPLKDRSPASSMAATRMPRAASPAAVGTGAKSMRALEAPMRIPSLEVKTSR